MPGDNLGYDPNDEKQKTEFTNAELGLWTGRYREYFELYQRQAAGDFLSPAEEERFLELRGEIADHEKVNPQQSKQVIDIVKNSTQPKTDVNGDGKLDANDIQGLINSTFSQNTRTQVKSDQTVQQTSVTYVDLPTPEEFLSDWSNAFGIHVTGLVQTGAVRPEVAAFARQMEGQIFDEYLRKQTERLLAGEPLWKVVGTEAENRLVGARTGEQTDTTSQQQTQVNSQISSTERTTGGAQTAAGQAVESGGSTSGSTSETTDSTARTKFDQTEAEVARNKLAYVPSLAPLDFLKDSATAQRLNFLYAGQKGTEQRAAQTASGRESTAARRI